MGRSKEFSYLSVQQICPSLHIHKTPLPIFSYSSCTAWKARMYMYMYVYLLRLIQNLETTILLPAQANIYLRNRATNMYTCRWLCLLNYKYMVSYQVKINALRSCILVRVRCTIPTGKVWPTMSKNSSVCGFIIHMHVHPIPLEHLA